MNLIDIKNKYEENNLNIKFSELNFFQKSYRKLISNILLQIIPPFSEVLDIGSGNGFLTKLISHKTKVDGVEPNYNLFIKSKKKYKNIKFYPKKVEDFFIKYDYLLLSDTLSYVFDVQNLLLDIKKNLKPEGKIILTIYNPFFKPLIDFAQLISFLPINKNINWLTQKDIENLLNLVDFEIIKKQRKVFLPINIPILTKLLNTFVEIFLPFLCLKCFYVCRPSKIKVDSYSKKSLSLIIPARNEEGNIESIIHRLSSLNMSHEIIFIEGNSTDNTWDEINNIKKKYKNKKIIALKQPGKGKYDAVKFGIKKSKGFFFLILDSDMTVPPEEIIKFYNVLASNKAEMVNGVRLVYPLEKDSMQYLNFIANKFFSYAFSWVFKQKISDTLCGTKGMSKENYNKISNIEENLKINDPFGDFDLIYGASYFNLKISDIPVRYQKRDYGSTNINRFKHGLILFKILFKLIHIIKFK